MQKLSIKALEGIIASLGGKVPLEHDIEQMALEEKRRREEEEERAELEAQKAAEAEEAAANQSI